MTTKHPRNPHIDRWDDKPVAEPEVMEASRRKTDKLADRVRAADNSHDASDKSPFSSARDMKIRHREGYAPTTGDSHTRESLPKSKYVDPLSRRWTGK
jgi:hypothetical protein